MTTNNNLDPKQNLPKITEIDFTKRKDFDTIEDVEKVTIAEENVVLPPKPSVPVENSLDQMALDQKVAEPENEFLIWQKQRAEMALKEEQKVKENLTKAKDEVMQTSNEIEKLGNKIDSKTELTESRVDLGKGTAIETARSVDKTAEKIQDVAEELKDNTKEAIASRKDLKVASDEAKIEVKKYNQLKKIDFVGQKEFLKNNRKTA